eukprot:gene1022-354_t
MKRSADISAEDLKRDACGEEERAERWRQWEDQQRRKYIPAFNALPKEEQENAAPVGKVRPMGVNDQMWDLLKL